MDNSKSDLQIGCTKVTCRPCSHLIRVSLWYFNLNCKCYMCKTTELSDYNWITVFCTSDIIMLSCMHIILVFVLRVLIKKPRSRNKTSFYFALGKFNHVGTLYPRKRLVSKPQLYRTHEFTANARFIIRLAQLRYLQSTNMGCAQYRNSLETFCKISYL